MNRILLLVISFLSVEVSQAADVIWIHDGDDLARLEFSSPTSATFHYIGKFGVGATGPAGTVWNDLAGPTLNSMLDINWNSDSTKMYGISSAQGGTNSSDAYLWTIDPKTGAATQVGGGNAIPGDGTLPSGSNGRDNFTIPNALGLAADGRMLTAINTDNAIFSIDLATNTATLLGAFGGNPTVKVSSGDVAAFRGATYLIASQATYAGGVGETNYLVKLDLADLPASSIVGPLAPSFDSGWGLASTADGLYAIDGDSKTVGLINLSNGQLTPVAIAGDTTALTYFSGASSVPEPGPGMFAVLIVFIGLRRGRRPPLQDVEFQKLV